MKHTRRLFALLLALCMVLALACTAFAAEGPTVTYGQEPGAVLFAAGESDVLDENNGIFTKESLDAVSAAYAAYLTAEAGSAAEAAALEQFRTALYALQFVPNTFTDTQSGWYVPAVNFVQAAGIMDGVGNNIFNPGGTMTRAMAVTVLYRYFCDDSGSVMLPFTDVPADTWYSEAVAWAYANDIVKGTTPTTFSPGAPVTREQMATLLARIDADSLPEYTSLSAEDRQYVDNDLASIYKDYASISAYARPAVRYCYIWTYMQGNPDGTFSPGANMTRAQCAQMLKNFFIVDLAYRFGFYPNTTPAG